MSDHVFQSQFELTLDQKNRLTIPSKCRDPFKSGLVLVLAYDVPAVAIEPEASYREFVQRAIQGGNPLSTSTKRVERFLNSMATPLDMDAQGRITISAKHLQHAKINAKDVLLIGSGARLELWAPEEWDNYAPTLQEAMLEIGQTISDLNIGNLGEG